MVLDTGGYGSIRSGEYERLRGVLVPVVNQTPLGLHQESYNGVSFLTGDQGNASRRYTWKDVASESTTSE